MLYDLREKRPRNSGDDECVCPDDAMEIDHGEINDYEQYDRDRELMKAPGAKFILRMKEGLCLSQQACDEMVPGVTELFSGIVDHLHQSVRSVCETAEHLVDDVDGVFYDKSKVNPFLGLSSQRGTTRSSTSERNLIDIYVP